MPSLYFYYIGGFYIYTMNWKKDEIEKALQSSNNKREVLLKLNKSGNCYKTLNKYIKLFDLDESHLKPHCKTIENKNILKIYSKGDKHPTEELYFWQYRYDRVGSKSFELWCTKEVFDNKKMLNKKSSYNYTRSNVLAYLTRSSLYRESKNIRYSDGEELIDIKYIESLWNLQNGLCYWFGIPMSLEISNKKETVLEKVSIDRIDSSKGYTKGNVVLCTNFANRGKGNSSYSDWIALIKKLKNNE